MVDEYDDIAASRLPLWAGSAAPTPLDSRHHHAFATFNIGLYLSLGLLHKELYELHEWAFGLFDIAKSTHR